MKPKRFTVSFFMAVMILSLLTGCGAKKYTFDDISTMTTSDQEYTINSIDGETFLLHGGRTAAYINGIGTVYYSSEKTTYSYSLEDDNTIVVDGKHYTYTIDARAGKVTFSPSFLGCGKVFDFGVNFK